MPRRKPSADAANADPAVTEIASGGPNEMDEVAPPAPTSGDPLQAAPVEAAANGDGVADGQSGQRPWRRNFETLAVPESGIYSGEDRKFAQVYIAFDKERPTDEQKAKMTEAGFRYRSAEKRWDMPATAASRQKVKALVAEFTGVTLGAAPGR